MVRVACETLHFGLNPNPKWIGFSPSWERSEQTHSNNGVGRHGGAYPGESQGEYDCHTSSVFVMLCGLETSDSQGRGIWDMTNNVLLLPLHYCRAHVHDTHASSARLHWSLWSSIQKTRTTCAHWKFCWKQPSVSNGTANRVVVPYLSLCLLIQGPPVPTPPLPPPSSPVHCHRDMLEPRTVCWSAPCLWCTERRRSRNPHHT